MFDVTPDEIAQLNDTDLRELVGRLCEAELAARGLSPAAVTWGGNQTAADGGLDVRVALPAGTSIDGFIPRFSTGFQVKTPDMARAAILAEMRPSGTIRPVIQELAGDAGAYIIVSSHGSTSDTALGNRRDALREGLTGVRSADQLQTDFYDRTRLATWVRRHPGLITWVKERIGRALVGWRPYGAWSTGAEGVEADYLLDDKLRLHLGKHRDAPAQPVAHAIDSLRDALAQPGKMVRLVGLSGVGKTRLVQALFDARIGSRPLPVSLAVYTNLSDNPDPQPTGLASDLIANRTRTVLIVDNCPPDLHRRLSDLCATSGSTVSVLTVEYDVRDDQPEGTQVVTLDTSSPELIEKLVRRRYPHLSEVDARTIAEASGGNARIAIALAGTVGRSESIAGFSDVDLFERLFWRERDRDQALLLAAKTCALLYSFHGEALTGDEAELPRLAVLAGQTPAAIYRHVADLRQRDLVQQRGVWRAVLPHALANRLAAWGLDEIPYDLIDQQLVTGGTERLARSFSRRLSFMHEHPRAIDIVKRWLAPGGFLGDVTALNDLGRAMFENVAPVLPEAALATLERAGNGAPEVAATEWRRHRSLLRSLAYDPPLFERSASMLARAATQSADKRDEKEAADTFASLFTIHLSGTHATIEQRLGVIERLLRSGEPKQRSLGLAALDEMVEATHFGSSHRFEFGARSRDYGYRPKSDADVTRWYGAALELIERLALTDGVLKPELRDLLARNFRGLWTSAHMYNELESLSRRFAAEGFWREGWAACRRTMRYDRKRLMPEGSSRLTALEAELRPSNLPDRVRAVILGDRAGGLDEDIDLDGDITSKFDRLDAIARELGAAVAADEAVFADFLPDLLRGGNRAWAFGWGLAAAPGDRPARWARLVEGLDHLPLEQRNVQVLRGFLAELWEEDRDFAQELLDAAFDQPALVAFLPVLHSAVQLDARSVERLTRALNAGQVPIEMYRNLAFGRATDHLAGRDLRGLLLLIADQPDGFDVALEILHMRLFSDTSAKRPHDPALLEAGRELLGRLSFKRDNHLQDHNLAWVATACLVGDDAGAVAARVTWRLKQAVANYQTYSFDNDNLLRAMLAACPLVVMNALFVGDEESQRDGLALFPEEGEDHRTNPADAISTGALIEWCEQNPEERYLLASSIVTFARRADETGPKTWSEQAILLMQNAPSPEKVLQVFIKRFRPMSWSGSRAAVMEANARLLYELEPHVAPNLMRGAEDAKAELVREIAIERRRETEEDKARDERFE